MKRPNNFNTSLLAALLGLGLAGCQTQKSVAPMGHGYEEVSHPHHTLIDEPEPPRISFQHRDVGGHTIPIWPSLYGVNEVIKGDLALFVGEKAYTDPDRVTHPRLFAVTWPELPLDITDEILWRWAKANGRDFTRTVEKFALITPTLKNGQLELVLEFLPENKWLGAKDEWPDRSGLQLTWSQLAEIVRNVKAKGVLQKDLRWHTPYIGEKF